MIHPKSTVSAAPTTTTTTITATVTPRTPSPRRPHVHYTPVRSKSASSCISAAHPTPSPSPHRPARHRNTPMSPPFHVPLINCLTALLMVLNTALNNRAEKGQRWLTIACASSHAFDLARVIPLVPKPMLSALSISQIGHMYRAALQLSRSPFDLLSASPTLEALVQHIVRNTNVSPSALVIAVVYIDRLTTAMPHMFVTRTNLQTLFAVAFVLAAKWLEDLCLPSNYFARFFGMHPLQFGQMETWFAAAIGYTLFVSTEQFHDAQVALMVEALDSESGLHVFQTLLHHNIAFVQNALHIAPSWKELPVQPPMPYDDAVYWENIWQMAGQLLDTPGEQRVQDDEFDDAVGCDCIRVERRMVRGQEVVQELAQVQLAHDFSVTPERLFAPHWRRYFTEIGLARYAKLDRIARDEWVKDLILPPLQQPEVPWGSWWPKVERLPHEEHVPEKGSFDFEAFIMQAAAAPVLSVERTLAPD